MTVLTLRYQRGDFVVTGPDIEPVMFKTRREAWAWCLRYHPGSLVKLIAANARAKGGATPMQSERQVGGLIFQ
jgi:hypothetical protein